MNNLFVSYELALKLKEKGFDEPCLGFYTYKGEIRRYTNYDGEQSDFQILKNSKITMGHEWCTAPLYQQVIDWLMEKLKKEESAYVYIEIHSDYSGAWHFPSQPEIDYIGKEIEFSSINAGIEESLKLI